MKPVKLLKIGSRLAWLAILFWIIETAFFLIRDGWHWTATDPIEMICDSIVVIVFNIGCMMMIVGICTWAWDQIMKENEKPVHGDQG